MRRTQRIFVVVASAICLLSLFVAFMGLPLYNMLVLPHLNPESSRQHIMLTSSIFFIAIALAAVSFVYIFVVVAKWFIGRPEETHEEPVSAAN